MEDENRPLLEGKNRPLATSIFSPVGLTIAAMFIFLGALFLIPGLALSQGDIIVLLGIMFAITGWLFTSAVSIQSRIKQHTFDLIIKTRFDDIFKQNSNLIRINFDNNYPVAENIAKEIFYSKDEKKIEIRNAVGDILNFYEILAISIWYRDADDEIYKEYYKDLLIEDMDKLETFVPIWRIKNKEAFIYTEWLYDKWK